MNAGTCLYKAFISYRHVERDRVWARWLIEKLETYRTPHGLVAHGIAGRIGHLFRDDDEIPASSDLTRQIEEALQASEYLIVVCSPRTPHSRWVRREIEIFQHLGRSDHILALLTEGEPEESFPPELLRVAREHIAANGSKDIVWEDVEPIAADVRDHPEERASRTRQRALLRIAASLLGCRYDDLAQRDRARRTRQLGIWGAAATLSLLLLAGGIFAYWNNYRVQTHYYAGFGTRWGVPFGIHELTRSAASRRSDVYQIDIQRGRVIEMRHTNAYGTPIAGTLDPEEIWEQGAAVWDIAYSHGKVQSIVLKSPVLAPMLTENYAWDAGEAVVSFYETAGRPISLGAGAADIFSTRPAAGAARVTQHRLTFTKDGLVAKRAFETPYGTPEQEADGSSQIEYRYNKFGSPEEVRQLDDKGQLLSSGVSEQTRSYDARGALTGVVVRDASGVVRGGISLKRDSDGNIVELSIEGQPVAQLTSMSGVARLEIHRDANGNAVDAEAFDDKGQRTWTDAGVSQSTTKYDGNGRAILASAFGLDGKPVYNKDGYAAVSAAYDARGDVIEQTFLGLDGKPIVTADGCAGLKYAYNADGRQTWMGCLGVDGQLHADTTGVAQESFDYNERGLVSVERFLDRSGHEIAGGPSNCAKQTFDYDERNNQTEDDCFGPDDKLKLNINGYAKHMFVFDDRGNVVGQSNYGVDGNLIVGVNAFGFATLKQTIDGIGQIAKIESYDAAGQPMVGSAGFFRAVYSYDTRGDTVAANLYGIDSRPIMGSMRARYDNRGHQIEQEFLDGTGQTISKTSRTYDVSGSNTELTERFGPGGAVVVGTDGCARLEKRFNARGWNTDDLCLAADGKPKLSIYGSAQEHFQYDALGRPILEQYYDTDGRPAPGPDGCAGDAAVFDGRGEITESDCLDPMNHRTIAKYGAAVTRFVYNNLGLETERTFYDVQDKPFTKGLFRIETRYDGQRRAMEYRDLDYKGHLLGVRPAALPQLPPAGASSPLAATTNQQPGGQARPLSNQ